MMLILSQVMLVLYARHYFLNQMMIGYKKMENSILSCFETMIYIFLKLVIKNYSNATVLFNFISSCNTSKSLSFDLRKIDKSFPPLSKTKTTFQPRKSFIFLKNTSSVSQSIFINHLCIVYMFVKFVYLYLLLPFVLLVLPFLFLISQY